jgi:hypothetical protein
VTPTYSVRKGPKSEWRVYRNELHIFSACGDDARERAGEYARWIASNGIESEFIPRDAREARSQKANEYFEKLGSPQRKGIYQQEFSLGWVK